MSAHQIQAMVGIRISRRGSFAIAFAKPWAIMEPHGTGGFGGAKKVVEVDETYVGGKARNRAPEGPRRKGRSVAS